MNGWQFFKYELLSVKRSFHEYLYPLMIFVLIVSLFPLAVSPDSKDLQFIAPGVVWVAVLLCCLLSFDNLLRRDWESGFLDKMLLSPHSLTGILLVKFFAHWLATAVPLILAAPVMGLFFHLTYQAELALVISLLLGTPIICLLGGIGAALTLGLKQQSLLLMILVLPLFVPVLIFGASAVSAASMQISAMGQYAFLGGLMLIAVCFVPFTVAAILRIGVAN